MDIKVLHAADLHLDSPFSSFPPAQKEALKEWQRKIPERLLEISRENGCSLWLLAGDIFDGDASTATVVSFQKAICNSGVPVLISPGNHDSFSSRSPWTQFQWPENAYIFHEETLRAIEFPELDCRVWGAAFRSMDSSSTLESFTLNRKYKYELCVMHGDAVNIRSLYNPVSAAQVRKSGLDYIALGHNHNRGCYQSGDSICGWPGCPMGRGWDEKGEKGVYVCELSDRVSVQFHPLNFPSFYELEVKDPDELEAVLPPVPKNDFFKVAVGGRKSISLSELYSNFSYLKYVEFIDCSIKQDDPWKNIQENSFKGVYFRKLYEELERADSEDKELIAMAAQISQDILNGLEVDLS